VSRSILDAARELFVTYGYQEVSIRKIADKIEYSPAAIYGYFPSKDDIFFALAEEGFRLLSDPDDPAHRDRLEALDPLARLHAIFWRLYEFSRDYPSYFALMFVDRSVPRICREYERFQFAREMKAHIVAHIQACVDTGILPKSVNPLVAVRLLTMGLLGVATLRLSDRLRANENPDDLARDVLNLAIAGLQSGVPLASTPPDEAFDEVLAPVKAS